MHQKTSILVPGAETAVLFIHGIVGSPAHFRQVIDLEGRVPKDWSFVNICLPGHGGTVMDFANSSMKKWKAHVWQVFEQLVQDHRNVVIVGHSMGTLFALQLAAEYPEKISNILLLQCPLVVGLRPFGVWNLVRLPFGGIKPDNVHGSAMLMACGVRTDRNILKYAAWIPRFLELFAEMHSTRKCLPGLQVPAVAFQSKKDELVSNRSARILRKCGRVEVREFENTTHFYYTDSFKSDIFRKFDKISSM